MQQGSKWTLVAAELPVLKGHGFSRAAKTAESTGLQPLRDGFLSIRHSFSDVPQPLDPAPFNVPDHPNLVDCGLDVHHRLPVSVQGKMEADGRVA
jgi:hypothetical protein